MRRGTVAALTAMIFVAAIVTQAWAETPDIERTKAYLTEKIPLFVLGLLHEGDPVTSGLANDSPKMPFAGCRTTIRISNPANWYSLEVDFAAMERVELRSTAVTLFPL